MITAERETVSSTSAYSNAVQSRYKDAYNFARSSVDSGNLIKALAVIAGVICIGVSCWAAAQSDILSVAVAGAVVGVLVGMSIYLFGMMIAAQGQVLMAVLDTALNTSPYLDDDARAEAMSLVKTSQGNIPPTEQTVEERSPYAKRVKPE